MLSHAYRRCLESPCSLNSLPTTGMSPPRFEDRISSFTVTFPNHPLLSEDAVRWITALGEHGLTDSQCVARAHPSRWVQISHRCPWDAVVA